MAQPGSRGVGSSAASDGYRRHGPVQGPSAARRLDIHLHDAIAAAPSRKHTVDVLRRIRGRLFRFRRTRDASQSLQLRSLLYEAHKAFANARFVSYCSDASRVGQRKVLMGFATGDAGALWLPSQLLREF